MTEIASLDELRELSDSILKEAKKQGAEQAQVTVNSNENIATRYGEKHITQNTQRNSVNFTLRIQIGQKIGLYQGSKPDQSNLSTMVDDAISLAKFSVPDPEFPGFVETQPNYTKSSRIIIEMSPQEISEAIKIVISTASAVNNKITSVAGNLNYNATRFLLANTYGLEAISEGSTISGVVNTAATQGDGESRSAAMIAAVKFDDLDIETVAQEVAERAVKGLNQSEIDIGTYETVLGHNAVVELLGHLSFATSSTMLITHQSPFKDRLGEKVFDKKFTVRDATDDPNHFSAKQWDYDGVPSPGLNFVDQGVIKDFAYNIRNSAKLGTENNGKDIGTYPLFTALSVKTGSKSEEELIASIDDGVYITNLFYTNFINMPEGTLTGLTKDGLFRIKNGELTDSIKNMRFSDSLFSLFATAEPANNSRYMLHQLYGTYFGLATKTPSIKLGAFNFSSKGKH